MELIDTTGLPIDYGYISLAERKRLSLKDTGTFQICKGISVVMDKYFLDPIIGFFFPGVFDLLTQMLVLPFIYSALFQIKSVPLALAMIYNSMIDAVIGIIPIVGDIADVFYRSHVKNYKLMLGYVEGDQEIIHKVKSGAIKCVILIAILGLILYQLIIWIHELWAFIISLFN